MKIRSFERDFVIFPEGNGKIRLPDAGAFANRNDKTTSGKKINENSESISCHRIEHGSQSAARTLSRPYKRAVACSLEPFGNSGQRSEEADAPRMCRVLGVSVNSVNRYIKSGRLKAVNISPRLVRIDPESVRELLKHGVPEDEIIVPQCHRKEAAR